ncbi:MAG TPA: PilX N-terminal domain-containing pilus assembly protein [Albitalea sp.]|nr:PilX N-terminal domain-containing pilus assembly protein [Albitalea sp.]
MQRQRGAAALIVTLILFFVMTLVAAYANRNNIFEQRASANQYRATQAAEAAEAGVEWALAMLNDPRPIDEQCRPSAEDTSFRERYLHVDAVSGSQSPATWDDLGTPTTLQAVCVRQGAGWDCSCPAAGRSVPALASEADDSPAFVVAFASHGRPGVVSLQASGCTRLAGPCNAGAAAPADATATLHADVGLLPGLVTLPVAPLTVKGSVHAGRAALGLHNGDADSGGATVQAGAEFVAANASLTTAPGAPVAGSIIESDAALAAMPADRLFVAFFGLDKAQWQQHPAVARVRCPPDCGSTVLAAIADAGTNRMIWVDGDLPLRGPIRLGDPDRPVLIVCSGAARLEGPVTVHGLVYAASLSWQDGGSGPGLVRGAAISETGYWGDAAADLVYDAHVLAALRTWTGSFVRVAGSWRDF